MEIILTEKIDKLGDIGDLVSVKSGFARNFLIPANKALLANEANKKAFEEKKADFVDRNNKAKQAAKKIFDKINDKFVVITNHASDEGRLYGSVMPKDIADKIATELKADIKKSQIVLDSSIREIGIIKIKLRIHADYIAEVNVNVARSVQEAKDQLKKLKQKEEAQLAPQEEAQTDVAT
jgi:large subunit ribosomal protein L9